MLEDDIDVQAFEDFLMDVVGNPAGDILAVDLGEGNPLRSANGERLGLGGTGGEQKKRGGTDGFFIKSFPHTDKRSPWSH